MGGVALACGLAACSSTTPSSSTSTTAPPSGSTSTSSPPSTAVPPTSSTSTTGATGLTTCLATQLSIVPLQGNGAAGTIYQTFSLTNTSSTTCTLDGYPGMQLLGSQGTSIPTNVVRGGLGGGAPAAAGQAPALVTLAPDQVASFAFQYEDVPVGNETSCPTSAKAEITPPNDVTFAVVTLQIAPCGGGTVHVSPIFAAS